MIEEIIKSRRSIRKYKAEVPSMETIEEILSLSILGPSYASSRPVEFLLVTEKENLKKLADMEMFGTQYLKDAPMCILVMTKADTVRNWVEECAIVSSYIGLCAVDKGLSTCWVNVREGETQDGRDYQEFFKEEFGVPKDHKVLTIIPIGTGDERVRRREEIDIKSKIHMEKY